MVKDVKSPGAQHVADYSEEECVRRMLRPVKLLDENLIKYASGDIIRAIA